ncbi:MAG TPA: nitronate monooxygenase, partial [Elusimicrobiota bacterium]|nr:nitronate monooxygenase [Elusimicrobiota bacterium]
MGIGISTWRLARVVAMSGQLGVVSCTSIDVILARRLQDGDPDGAMRRALKQFPFPEIAERIVKDYYIPGGRSSDAPY